MGKKTGCSVKLVMGRGAKLMFSFVSRAKPGKHFLIETDDEDGQLENEPVLQHGSVAKKNGAVPNPGSAMRVEKCKIGKEWQEHNGKNW